MLTSRNSDTRIIAQLRETRSDEIAIRRNPPHRLGPFLILHHLRVEHIDGIAVREDGARVEVRVAQDGALAHVFVAHEETAVDEGGGGAAE